MFNRVLKTLVALSAIAISSAATAQDGSLLAEVARFSSGITSFNEGFVQSTCDNDFVYHSLRNDITESMLVRCTDGTMYAEWLTSPVSGDHTAEGAGFVWMASVNLTSGDHNYDLYVDGIRRFQFSSGANRSWEYKSDDGGKLSFFCVQNDMHGDGMGYMTLWAPASWLTPGNSLRLKLVGHAEGSDSWIIVFKATDTQSYLQTSVKYNKRVSMTETPERGRRTLVFESSPDLAGKELVFGAGKKETKFVMAAEGDKSRGQISISTPLISVSEVSVSDEYGLLLSTDPESLPQTFSKLGNNYSVQSVGRKEGDGSVKVTSVRSYRPGTAAALSQLAGSTLARGKIFLMVSSHQDIAWMDSPEKCVIERDTMLLTPLFRRAATDKSYRFDIENALLLKEYVHRHPDSREMIGSLLAGGQLSCGSSYIQPYEEMYSGEALIRQFYFGSRWLKKEFGYTADTYFNPDVPGRTMQMPQILKKSGTNFMSVSRMEAGLYKWYSPDGSSVLTYSPGHYSEAFRPLAGDFYDAAEYLAGTSLRWVEYYDSLSPVPAVPVLSSWDMSPPVSYSHLIDRWNTRWEVMSPDGRDVKMQLPEIIPALTTTFMTAAEQNNSSITSLYGERPAVWLYIHGPTHQKAINASRQGDILLTVAEKFATANALIDNSFVNYPEERLNRAWEAKIYPDHGWGGKHGDITDALFKEKYYFARSEAEAIITATLSDISSKIRVSPGKGIPVMVFNSLSWERSDRASFEMIFEKGWGSSIQLLDHKGSAVPVQLSKIVRHEDGSLKSAQADFIAEGVPSIGYRTYYVRPSADEIREYAGDASVQGKGDAPTRYSNKFYKVRFADGGLSSIYDLDMGLEIVDTTSFKAGEIFTMRSVGTGAGEFSDIQQPDMEGFDRAANYPHNWKIAETGDVYTMFVNRQPIRNAVIEEKIIFYNELKRIDFIIDLLNYDGVLYREYRMALPLKMTGGEICYEVPFGKVTVGKDEIEGAAGERYDTPCEEIHPRGIQNWIGADNDSYGVILSSSVAVADYIDPTDNTAENHILQPLLIASRRSCHGEGNEYLQTGDHQFGFSFTSYPKGGEKGRRFGVEANEKLIAVTGSGQYADAALPEEMSFFSIDDEADNLIISTVKKAEDEPAVIIRIYDTAGRGSDVTLKSFRRFGTAVRTNLIEETLESLPVNEDGIRFGIGKYSIETLLIR